MIYVEEYKVRTNDFDTFDHLTFQALFEMFQDAAGTHATILGLGYEALKAKGLYWVIAKTRVTKFKEVSPFDKIYVKTWPLEKGKLDFIRNYIVYDASNNMIAKGVSQWCLIDTVTRKIVKTDGIDYPNSCINEKIYDSKLSPILPVSDDLCFDYLVGNKDIDHNGHMNNAKYASLVLDALRKDELLDVLDCQINYHQEASVGEVIHVYRKTTSEGIVISGNTEKGNCFNALVK